MKKLLLVSLCFLMLCATEVFAQNRTVTGTVTAKDDGLPLPGVTVKVKGTSIGTQTGANGKFTLSAPANGVLQFSFIGYTTTERPVGTGAVNVTLESGAIALGEVVVSAAFGRKLEDKAQGYAATHVTGGQLTTSAPTNLLNGLAGKVAGLQITQTGTGIDAGIKVQLRGSRSISGNNQALIVVDGTVLPGGDISSIDPNTIESTDVLNGSSAGVLYGSDASNGVILITTKKGAAGGKPTVTYSNSFQIDQAAFFPKIQNQFGAYGGETLAQGYIDPITFKTRLVPYENELYGPAFDGHTYTLGAPSGSATGPQYVATYAAQSVSPVKAFFNNGITEQNILSIASGNADDYFNLSALSVLKKGVVPNDKRDANTATIKAGKKYGIFKAEYSLSYTNAKLHQIGNDYNAQGVNYAVQQFASNLNIKDFQDLKGPFGNPSDYFSDYSVNPYWATENSFTDVNRNIFIGNINLTLSPTKYLDVIGKLTDNFGTQEAKQKQSEVDFTPYSIADPLQGGNIPSSYPGGVIQGQTGRSYSTGDGTGNRGRLQTDFMLNFHPVLLKDFKTTLLVGTTYSSQQARAESLSGTNLLINGFYNLATNAAAPNFSESESTVKNLAYFGNLNIGYKDFLFLDASLREEQDSRLTVAKNAYYYPGVNASFVFTDAIPALKGNKILSYGKIRASYGITSQISVGPYNINDTFSVTTGGFPYGSLGGLTLGTTHYTTLVPERNTEIEGGIELGFFDNMIHSTFTVYKQNDKNQTLNLGVSNSTGFGTIVTNVGELQSSGWELGVNFSPLTKAKNKVSLDLGMTLADQESNLVSIIDNVPYLPIGNSQYAYVGHPYPYFKGTDYQRDPQGRVIVSSTTGLPLLSSNSLTDLGRSSPEYQLGLTASVGYKFIKLDVTAEYRGGFVSQYAAASTYLFTGSSAYTTQNGRERFIYPNSVYVDAGGNYVPNTSISTNDGNYKFWTSSIIANNNAPYITNGAYWKIRDAALSFNLNDFVKKAKFIKGLRFSLTGRNLAIWVPKTNFWGDPDVSVGTSQGGTVTGIASNPAQRTYGAKLDVTF